MMKCAYLTFLAVGLMACSSTLDVGDHREDAGPGATDGSSPEPRDGSTSNPRDGSTSDPRDGSTSNPRDGSVTDPSSGEGGVSEPHGTKGPPNAKRMFVTSAAYPGDFATHGTGDHPGADGADKLCGTAAASANLGGTWRAWISTYTPGQDPVATAHHAIDRIAEVPGGWYNVDRTAWLFTNKANLASVPNDAEWRAPSVSLVKNEYGHRVAHDTSVWTGTDTGGRLTTRNCKAWTVKTFDVGGTGGSAGRAPNEWTAGPYLSCNGFAHFYCFEQ